MIRKVIFILIFFPLVLSSDAAGDKANRDVRINVLVLLDASFSMKEKWNTRTKFEIAADQMVEIIGESFRDNPEKHFAFRVFGNNSGMKESDCFDTELLIDFGQRNLDSISAALKNVHPKGWSPISLSIEKAARDFTGRDQEINALIFITDGGETCGGDPCAAAKILHESGVVTLPFVVGLGRSIHLVEDVGCIGEYQMVGSEEKLRDGLNKIMDRIDLQTTAQVYFLDAMGNRNETNIPFSFKRRISRMEKNNFVHALSDNKMSDTITLSAIGDYELIAHTTPEIIRSGIHLVEDKHNTVLLEAERGELELKLLGDRGFADFECIIRNPSSNEILNVQPFNSSTTYLAGSYDLEITSFPRIYMKNVEIGGGEKEIISVSRSGHILIKNKKPLYSSVYRVIEKKVEKVRELYKIEGSNSYMLQPGRYILIYNYEKDKPNSTKEYEFNIEAGRVTTIQL
ncbi:MAG: VWA domain-containing protein [Chitinophagales bacterium]|nr:VWA domain-containing protein [Chitinophagales bacterium]